jgi:hypothetical protein
VLAAIAHAAGFHRPGRSIELVDERPRFVDVDALYTWPELLGGHRCLTSRARRSIRCSGSPRHPRLHGARRGDE